MTGPIKPATIAAFWRDLELRSGRWKNLDKVKKAADEGDECCKAIYAALQDVKAELDYLHHWALFLNGVSWSLLPGDHYREDGGGGGAPPQPPPDWPP